MAKYTYLFGDKKDKKQLLENGEAIDLSPIKANTQLNESEMKWHFEKTDF